MSFMQEILVLLVSNDTVTGDTLATKSTPIVYDPIRYQLLIPIFVIGLEKGRR